MEILVALYRDDTLLSRAIQWQTRGAYSHASIVLANQQSSLAVEAWHRGGVRMGRVGRLQPTAVIDLFTLQVPVDVKSVQWFLMKQLGKPYDWLMVAGFVTRRTREARRSYGKWFCSELVYAALEEGGCDLLCRTKPWEVSPDLLKRSPKLLHYSTITAKEATRFKL